MEQPQSLKILEVCKISPSSSSVAELSLPLTFLDLCFFQSPPTERIFFFSLTTKDPPFESILSNLKYSLSLSLSYFLPLAGNLTWPNDSPEPCILYKNGDAVSLTVAESDADFDRLCSNQIRKASESRCLIQDQFQACDTVAPAMSLQITFFPNNGFSIGVITNHVVTDGKTTTMFMKSWASICKLNLPTPPSELTPVFDRTTTKDPTQLDKLYAKYFPMFISSTSQEKKLKLRPKVTISDDVMSGTFELSNDDIKNLRKKVATSEKRHLSTFVLTYAYVSTCMIKAQQIEGKNKVGLGFLVDCRSRSEFPTPVNYFGNGITGRVVYAEAREFEGENGFVNISTKLSDAIVELEEKMKKKAIVEFMEEVIIQWEKEMPVFKIIAVAGSPRFGVYGIDFGCGSCKKVEMTSLNPGEAISISDSREGNGGVQVGIALPKDDINVFASLFSNQLK